MKSGGVSPPTFFFFFTKFFLGTYQPYTPVYGQWLRRSRRKTKLGLGKEKLNFCLSLPVFIFSSLNKNNRIYNTVLEPFKDSELVKIPDLVPNTLIFPISIKLLQSNTGKTCISTQNYNWGLSKSHQNNVLTFVFPVL